MNLHSHINELCPADTAGFNQVIAALRSLPEQEVSPDFTERVMQAIQQEKMGNTPRLPCSLLPGLRRIAAAAIIVLGLIWGYTLLPLNKAQEVDPMLTWLAETQEPDGTWNPVRHGGAEEYRPALTALATLALARAPGNCFHDHIVRACEALAQKQLPDGSFGGSDRGIYYNQAITTYALATLSLQEVDIKPVVERALQFSFASQNLEGSWNYLPNTVGNTAITAWQVRTLSAANTAGFSGTEIPMRKALRWLRGTVAEDGTITYHRESEKHSECLNALTAYTLITSDSSYPQLVELGKWMIKSLTLESKSVDCYRDYAKALALRAIGKDSSARLLHTAMQKNKYTSNQDQWYMAGGKVYTTALTALTAP